MSAMYKLLMFHFSYCDLKGNKVWLHAFAIICISIRNNLWCLHEVKQNCSSALSLNGIVKRVYNWDCGIKTIHMFQRKHKSTWEEFTVNFIKELSESQ